MTLRPALGAVAVALLLPMTACTSGGSEAVASSAGMDPGRWANEILGAGLPGSPLAFTASGGIGPGSEAGAEFAPAKAGWHDIAIACNGSGAITVTISNASGELGTGNTTCGSAVTTTMELPAGKITVTVDKALAKGMWAVGVAPADAP